MKTIIVSANLSSNILSRKNLLIALQNDEWTIYAAGCEDSGVSDLSDMGIIFYELPMQNKGTGMGADFKTFFSFLQLYRKIRPAAVLHYNSKPDIYGSLAATFLGIRSISNITGLGTVYVGPDTLVRKIVNFLYRLAFSGSKNFVFFQNKEDQDLFIKLKIANSQKSGLLPGSGVDIHSFTPITLESQNDPKSQSIHPIRFLFASRLVISKGIREFIGAATVVRKEYPETVFDIIGEMLDYQSFIPRSELETAIASKSVTYHGNAKGSREWITKTDCVVLPSYYREGVPRILLEGAAMGKPLIAADSVGTREPIIHGLNGFLCNPGSTKDLASCMLQFLALDKKKREQMGVESRKIAVERFSDSIISEKYLKILNQGGYE